MVEEQLTNAATLETVSDIKPDLIYFFWRACVCKDSMLCKKSLALIRAQICSMAQDFPVAFSFFPSYCCSCPALFSPCNCCHQKTVWIDRQQQLLTLLSLSTRTDQKSNRPYTLSDLGHQVTSSFIFRLNLGLNGCILALVIQKIVISYNVALSEE